jgi:hypothetical protein
MADDARISTALPRHPKTVKLQRRLGAPGCWSLICLFLWVADNRPDGDLKGMTAEDIEIAAEWPGESGSFVATLSEIRFVDGQAGAYTIHDWVQHNPWAAGRPQRVAVARAAANKRWHDEHSKSAKPDAQGMPTACVSHESAMPTSPHLTTKPKTLPNPPFQGGNGDSSPRRLTSRETKRLNERIYSLQRSHLDQHGNQKFDGSGKAIPPLEFGEALGRACQIEFLPEDSAWTAAIQAGLGEARKPQKATA